MNRAMRFFTIGILSVMSVTGCHELGHVDGIGGYGDSAASEVVGEVEYVDTRDRAIDVRTDSGRMIMLRYDDGTQVIYRQRNYAVANLEPGDYIAARVRQDRDGRNYTDTITVRESVQDRTGGRSQSGSLDRIEGRVEYIDQRRGTFELRDGPNHRVVVAVPFNAPRSVIDRFNRLREGDFVRIEGRSVGADRFELEDFS